MIRAAILSLALLALAAPAGASEVLTIDPLGCGSCGGLTLELEVTEKSGGFNVLLSYSAPAGYVGDPDWESLTGLNQAGFKAIKNWTSVDLDWVELDGIDVTGWANPVEATTAANTLCTNGTQSDKVCTHGFVDLAGGGTVVFSFDVTGGTMLEVGDWGIGGQFAEEAGISSGHLISEPARAIPEPNAALVYGLGLLVVSAATRRRR